jgi:hypothetical protein
MKREHPTHVLNEGNNGRSCRRNQTTTQSSGCWDSCGPNRRRWGRRCNTPSCDSRDMSMRTPYEVASVASIVARRTNCRSGEVTTGGTIWIKSNDDKSVIRGLEGLKPSASRSETIESFDVPESILSWRWLRYSFLCPGSFKRSFLIKPMPQWWQRWLQSNWRQALKPTRTMELLILHFVK